jgi:photosystem II stability/assembly factor-like uncharacterized protein
VRVRAPLALALLLGGCFDFTRLRPLDGGAVDQAAPGDAALGRGWAQVRAPSGRALTSVAGVDPGAVYAAGEGGTFLRSDDDGATWTSVATGTSLTLNGVWASPTDVIVVGDTGTVLYGDGVSMYTGTSGTTDVLEAVWGSSDNDIIAVGDHSTIIHYNGNVWLNETPTMAVDDLRAVSGSSQNDVWAIGLLGVSYRYDPIGHSWNAAPSPVGTDDGLGLWARSPSDVYAGGGTTVSGDLTYWDGMNWTSAPGVNGGDELHAVTGNATEEWAVGKGGAAWHFDGKSWSPATAPTNGVTLTGAWMRASGELFAVAADGSIWRHD